MVKDCAIIHNECKNVNDHKPICCVFYINMYKSAECVTENHELPQSYPKTLWSSEAFIQHYNSEISIQADMIPVINEATIH